MVRGVTHRGLFVLEADGDHHPGRLDAAIVVQLAQRGDALERLFAAQLELDFALGRAEFVLLRFSGRPGGRLNGRGFLARGGGAVVRPDEICRIGRSAQQHERRNHGCHSHRHEGLSPRRDAPHLSGRFAQTAGSRTLRSILGTVLGGVNVAPARPATRPTPAGDAQLPRRCLAVESLRGGNMPSKRADFAVRHMAFLKGCKYAR